MEINEHACMHYAWIENCSIWLRMWAAAVQHGLVTWYQRWAGIYQF
jgi:hypothetical protein